MRLLPNKVYTTEPEISNTYNEIKHFIRPLSLRIRGGAINMRVSADNIYWELVDGSPFGAVNGLEKETISETVNWKFIKYTVVSGTPIVETTCTSILRAV